ncbi:MAG: relaxase MobL, partial [Firmicutes bacterium]|nr:relaxase MobL [Bacillota bacterium]
LDRVAEEVAAHKGNVWTHIISLRREDADRLGYNNVGEWMDLLRRQRNMLAKQMNIKPENFRWYAAFHDKEHHPHVHVMAWSSKPGEAWLSAKGIEGIKSAMARDIFQQDLVQVYQRQTQQRDVLRQDGRTLVADIVRQIKAGGYENQAMQELLMKLSERLKNLTGKKLYGYLPADAKATVDHIVDELAKEEHIAQLYDLWYEQREAVLATYRSEMPERLPLSQNGEFKSIKNAVIVETVKLAMEEKPVEQQTAQNTNEEQAPTAGVPSHLLGQLADLITIRILQEPQPKDSRVIVESKLWREEQEKKQAQGLRI